MGGIDDPFGYRITADERVRIERWGRVVVTVAGADARRLIARLGRGDDADQQLLARATGNYRRGNERS